MPADFIRERGAGSARKNLEFLVNEHSRHSSFRVKKRITESNAATALLGEAVLSPGNRIADENLVLREPLGGSARHCWASEQCEHRRTATRQHGLCGSSLKQLPLDGA